MQEMDVFLSIGPNCRPISYLRDYGLTWFAAPSDWYLFRDLDTLIHLYQIHFSDFLMEIQELDSGGTGNFRFVEDTRYNVTCLHQFDAKLPLSVGQSYVRKRTHLRARNTDQALKEANRVGLVGSWGLPREDLITFLKGFSSLYPGKKMVLYNIHHMPGEARHWKNETSISPDLSLVEYFFCDKGDLGSSEFWRGNQFFWKKIVETFRLSPESQKRRDAVWKL